MTTRSLTFHQQTRIAVNVIIEDDTGMLAFSILFVTGLFTVCWQISRVVSALKSELSLLAGDLTVAVDFTGKVLVIAFRSLTFGLGLKL
jgi:hypothetical protein